MKLEKRDKGAAWHVERLNDWIEGGVSYVVNVR